eukprot:65932-Pelagomonas_calceolata.AAC.1
MGCEDKIIMESKNPRRKKAQNESESKTLPSHADPSYTPPPFCKLKERIPWPTLFTEVHSKSASSTIFQRWATKALLRGHFEMFP